MKRTLEFVTPFEPELGKQVGKEVKVKVKKPGRIVQTLLSAREKTIHNPTDQAGAVELIPTIIIEVDPDEKEEERVFAILPGGKTIESSNYLEYRGSFLYPGGFIFFLYEEIQEPADIVELAKRTFQRR